MRHGVIGLGAFMNSLENTIVQIASGRDPAVGGARTRGFNFFSHDATNGTIPEIPAPPRDEFFRALTEDGAYAEEAPFPTLATVPEMQWKVCPNKGHLLAEILYADGMPADGVRVTIVKEGGDSASASIVQYADGNAYVGGIDLDPGAYELLIGLPGEQEERVNAPEPVVAGRVTRMRVKLSNASRGPVLRSQRVLTLQERLDHLTGASELEEWETREPLPEDILEERKRRPPE